jgi:branched-chain amino acid transport system ATP-binding protein
VILIDHDVGLVMGLCDRVTVLDWGRVIAIGPPEEVRTDPRVIDAYLGRDHDSGETSEAASQSEQEAR